MVPVFLIGFSICFVSGLLLSVVLFLKDFLWLKKNKHERFCEGAVALLFGIFQLSISIAGIVAITIAFTTKTEPVWLAPVTLCTLQLFAGLNLTWTLRGIKDSRSAVWLAYGSIVWTAPDIAFFTRDNFAYEYALLARVAIASTVSLAHWQKALRTHKDSGNRIAKRVHVLLLFVVANAVAASFEAIGAAIIYGLSFTNMGRSELRQGIVLACIFAQAGTLIALCVGSLERHRQSKSPYISSTAFPPPSARNQKRSLAS
ncbi:hypothetical protein PMIN02_011973 [Paraphaeosphaeria minitans]